MIFPSKEKVASTIIGPFLIDLQIIAEKNHCFLDIFVGLASTDKLITSLKYDDLDVGAFKTPLL